MTLPKRYTTLLLAPALATALAGCSLAPAYTRPDSALAPQWLRGRDLPLAQAVPVQSGWWRSFGDAALDALVERALRDSPTLAQAQARVEEARGTAEVAGAALYPALTLNGAVDRVHNASGANAGIGSGSGSNGQSLFAEAAYEVDFWGKNRAASHSAQALAQASVFDGDTVALTLTAAVADTYFQLLSSRERLALARSIAADAERLLVLVQGQARAGVATELQVEQQRNIAATFAAAVPVLQQQTEQDGHLLAVLVGAAPESFALPAAGVTAIDVPLAQAGMPSSILQRRPDIRAAEARLVSANFDVGVARAAFYPSLSLTADAGLSSASLGHLLSSNPLADIAASLVQPVFDGGQLRGQLAFDRARVTELAAAYRATVLGALQEVEDALSAERHQRELEDADRIAASSAQRASTLAQAQYRLGIADFLSVLTTQRSAFQAQDALLQVRLARLQAAVGLFRTLGGGFKDSGDSATAQMTSGEK
ncbi:MAG TPA: efflux transporter outer membrane subunit [Janthinobacterium sp.]|jgi:NodT family efflux transporter outer membrane factor (OMF) lipoprotein|nr:efflux transporter outer membrane subunit [Janthinobacterium sp.]